MKYTFSEFFLQNNSRIIWDFCKYGKCEISDSKLIISSRQLNLVLENKAEQRNENGINCAISGSSRVENVFSHEKKGKSWKRKG